MNPGLTRPNLLLEEGFLPDSARLFARLLETVRWDERLGARKTASFGVPYNYAQMEYDTVPFTAELVAVAERLAGRLSVVFNNCLLNFYEGGANTMGFHSDDTTHLLPGSGVAIVSLGSPRTLTFRLKRDRSHEVPCLLNPGSLLYMDAAIQDDWLHAVKPAPGAGPRISLTWRALVTS